MEGNTNAEKWSEEKATEFMNKAVELSKSKDYDFIGEIAKELDSYKDVFFYLCDKYPKLKKVFTRVRSNCEANCFNNIKKENINVGAGNIESRPVVELDFSIGQKDYTGIRFSIGNRASNLYKILVGKDFIQQDLDALIDVSKENIADDNVEADVK